LVVPGQQVEVDEREEIVERVAAIDVAKASGMVCTRVPYPAKAGKRITRVWQVGSTTNQILELADYLADQGIERVVVESTSEYWRPFLYLLEARGLCVWLVNAHQVKQVPGRPKTDKLDAVWLAKLNERGMLRRSFVPPTPIRRLRDYTRLRAELTVERSRHKQRLEQAVGGRADQAGDGGHRHLRGLRPGHAGGADRRAARPQDPGRTGPWPAARQARRPGGGPHRPVQRPPRLPGQDPAGPDRHPRRADPAAHHQDRGGDQRDPRRPTTSPRPRLTRQRPPTPPLVATPATGDPTDTGGPKPPAPLAAVDRLDEVPGIGRAAAQVLVAELGVDMGQFPTPAHLVSWARLSPRTIQSGAKHRTGATGKGNPYLNGVLGEVAAAAAKTDTFLGQRYHRLVRRIGKRKALVAVARSILVIVWHLLADPTARFHDLGPDYYTNRIDKDRKTRNHIRQLQALGYSVTLTPAA
jgi:transposase